MKDITLSGTATQFKGNGRQLGYPTANITAETDTKDGVYFGFADLGKFRHHPSLVFVGIPTTMGDTDRRVEIHLLGIPDEDYYGEAVQASLRYYHRANQTFANVDNLMAAMKADEAAARQWFKQSA